MGEMISNCIEIAVCDDEEILRRKLKIMLYDILRGKGISGAVKDYALGMELLKDIKQFDLVFLDIDMPEMDGIEVGRKIQQKNPNCRIAMASGREDRFKETYRLNPLQFISKPYTEDEISDVLQEYQRRCVGMAKIEVYKERKLYTFYQKDIQYVIANGNFSDVYINNILYRMNCSLNAMEEVLDKRCFFRIHKGHIVNLFFITDYEKDKVWIDKIKFPLSKRRQKEFEQFYVEFDIEYR